MNLPAPEAKPPRTAAAFRAWRLRMGASQSGVAKLLGVSTQAIYWWEAGDRPISPTLAMLCWFLEAYGVPPWHRAPLHGKPAAARPAAPHRASAKKKAASPASPAAPGLRSPR